MATRLLKREINKAENIINRLTTGEKSIIAKLEARNISTTAIKDKISQAQTVISQAKTSLASLTGSSTPITASSTNQEITAFRKSIVAIKNQLNQAIANIRQARKLIGQIPGIGKIEKATSTDDSI